MLLLLVLGGCGPAAALYADATWWPMDHVGRVVITQDQPQEATVDVAFWSDEGPALETVASLDACELGTAEFRGWTSVSAGAVTLDAGGGQVLTFSFDGFRYRLDDPSPLTIAPRVPFSVEAEGDVVAPFVLDPGLVMPGPGLAITRPDLSEGAVVGAQVSDLAWSGQDRLAKIHVRVRDRYGRQVHCVFDDVGGMAIPWSEEPWTELSLDGPLEVEVERRRTRYADISEGPLLLQTSFVQRFQMDPTAKPTEDEDDTTTSASTGTY